MAKIFMETIEIIIIKEFAGGMPQLMKVRVFMECYLLAGTAA
jgi:hypothetical protein